MSEVVATEEFEAWLAQQTPSTVDAVRFVVRLLMEVGPRLSRPYADTLKGSRFANMKELRVSTAGLAIRIAFAFGPDRRAVLLNAGDKRGVSEKRFYGQLIRKADLLFAEYLRS